MMINLSWSKQILTENSYEYNMLIKIRDFVYNQSGLYFAENKLDSLHKKLLTRVEPLNLTSLEEYYYYLLYDPAGKSELKFLFDSLTNNETSFFRDAPQLKAFQGQVITDLMDYKLQNGQKSIRILSCGCSTGEEPYTLAILIMERLGKHFDEWHFEIKGGDISNNALKAAKRGIYNQYSLRNTSERIINQYFTPVGNDQYSVNENIRKMVHFFYLNLKDDASMKTIYPSDVILCRNVLIYFNEASKKNVVSKFHELINQNGYLFVGPSESLFGLSRSFKLILCPGALVYKKEA